MRSTAAILLVVAFLAFAAVPAVAQEGTGDSDALTPLEQLEEMRRQFDEAVRASQQATSTAPGPTAGAAASETIRQLRLQVQELTYQNALLLESSEQAALEASESVAALSEANASLQTQIDDLEQQNADLQAELDAKRPPFWEDPADWAAILGGLAAGALVGVALTARRHADGHPAAEERAPSAPVAAGTAPDGSVEADPAQAHPEPPPGEPAKG